MRAAALAEARHGAARGDPTFLYVGVGTGISSTLFIDGEPYAGAHGHAIAFASILPATVRAADSPDSWITMKTKIALMTTEDLSTKDLNVDTVKGVVTLHGMVPTEAEKEKAEHVSMKIDGVKSVKNLLQVVPDSRRKIVERADDQIKDNVESAFKANHRIHDSGIKVASVNKGVVLLSGKTKSLEAHAESVAVVIDTRGEIVGNPELVLDGIPEEDLEVMAIRERLLDAVDQALGAMPRARRRDDAAVQELLRGAVRKAADMAWGKKPICHVMIHRQ